MKALLPFKLVYHENYDLNLGPHVFPSQKFRLIYEMLLREGLATQEDFLRPNPAADEDILRVNTSDWVRKLKTGTLTASDVMKLEVPYSKELVEAVWLATGGTILAAQSALRRFFAMIQRCSRFRFIRKTTIRRTSRHQASISTWPTAPMTMNIWACLFPRCRRRLTNLSPKFFFTLAAPIPTVRTSSADCH